MVIGKLAFFPIFGGNEADPLTCNVLGHLYLAGHGVRHDVVWFGAVGPPDQWSAILEGPAGCPALSCLQVPVHLLGTGSICSPDRLGEISASPDRDRNDRRADGLDRYLPADRLLLDLSHRVRGAESYQSAIAQRHA